MKVPILTLPANPASDTHRAAAKIWIEEEWAGWRVFELGAG
jgi:hypothetical protein